jgi:hypothetical protein
VRINNAPVATYLAATLTVIAAVFGGLVVLFGSGHGSDGLTFNQYLDAMSKFVIGIGILGVGRGLLGRRVH